MVRNSLLNNENHTAVLVYIFKEYEQIIRIELATNLKGISN